MKNRQQLKQELVEHYLWLRQYGCNDSHSGNASFRWHDEIWITPTGCCADTLNADDLVCCSVDGELAESASLDVALHIQSYQKNTEINAIFHSHNPHAVAMTLDGKDFVPVDFEGQYYFPIVPVICIKNDEYIAKSAEKVSNMLQSNKLTIVAGHGVYSCADSINLAYKWSCSLELSAKTAWLARQ